jgi:hypothetical protein
MDVSYMIRIEKVDLIGYDPVERIMEDLIIITTDIETNCKFMLLEIVVNLNRDCNW